MSKKKTVSTMSLKDFHGGSIPSDLPLPSAPGVMSKSGSDRNMSPNWGNNLMRADLHPRPKSSGAIRRFDEKASFLSHPAPIGRNFDEDERKPLDGLSAPRRALSDENTRKLVPVRLELKPDYVASVKGSDRPVSSPVPLSPGLGANPLPARLGGGTYANSQNSIHNNSQVFNNSRSSGGHNGWGANSNPPNVWGLRKDVLGTDEAGGSSASHGPDAESKYAQASALEKVSSGMWQFKSPSHLLPQLVHSEDNSITHSVDLGRERGDYGASHGSQAESGWGKKTSLGAQLPKNNNHHFPHMLYSADNSATCGVDMTWERGDYGASRGSQAEIGWVTEDGYLGGGKNLHNYWRGEPQVYAAEVQAGASSVGPQQQPEMPPELSESRAKQLEAKEEYRQGLRWVTEPGQNEIGHEIIGNPNTRKPGLTDGKVGSRPADRPVERPKLNLKPRSQPLERSDGSMEKKRDSLFGGARPRELVLKERGIDDIAINNLDLSPSPDRAKSPKNEVTSEHSVPNVRYGPKIEIPAPNRSSVKESEKKYQWMDHERNDEERRNRRNEKWKSSRDTKDQRPEPETWRKPIEEPKPTSSDASGTHLGKLPSALELAQAFSKSVSDSKRHDLHSVRNGQGGRNNQVPFSRLTDNREPYSASSTMHQINGY